MRPSVAAGARAFNATFEGSLNFMYLDALGLVTTGEGNLIDPVGAALGLPWQNADGSMATQEAIEAEWDKVKGLSSLDQKGGAVFGQYTSLRLSVAAVSALVVSKLASDETLLRTYFPTWDTFPADAQMGILSMAWAMGPGFPATWPHFTAAANAGNWGLAATQSQMEPSPGIGPRNAANLVLFQNAAAGGDPATLYYPGSPALGGVGGASGALALAVLAAVGGFGVWWIWKGHGA